MPTGLQRHSLRRRGVTFCWKTKSSVSSCLFVSARLGSQLCVFGVNVCLKQKTSCKTDSFLESTLLCLCTNHKMRYPRLIPSFSSYLCWHDKAGLAGKRANFELNPHGSSDRQSSACTRQPLRPGCWRKSKQDHVLSYRSYYYPKEAPEQNRQKRKLGILTSKKWL